MERPPSLAALQDFEEDLATTLAEKRKTPFLDPGQLLNAADLYVESGVGYAVVGEDNYLMGEAIYVGGQFNVVLLGATIQECVGWTIVPRFLLDSLEPLEFPGPNPSRIYEIGDTHAELWGHWRYTGQDRPGMEQSPEGWANLVSMLYRNSAIMAARCLPLSDPSHSSYDEEEEEEQEVAEVIEIGPSRDYIPRPLPVNAPRFYFEAMDLRQLEKLRTKLNTRHRARLLDLDICLTRITITQLSPSRDVMAELKSNVLKAEQKLLLVEAEIKAVVDQQNLKMPGKSFVSLILRNPSQVKKELARYREEPLPTLAPPAPKKKKTAPKIIKRPDAPPGIAPEATLCTICWSNDACMLSIACGHIFLCTQCDKPDKCPQCRENIPKMIRAYAGGHVKEEKEVKEHNLPPLGEEKTPISLL